ncbi:MAG: hypothetical protein O3C68_02740 [Proteobacteria bacterium]|nr:hypothetical protein [Pseudomonadota bacterium]
MKLARTHSIRHESLSPVSPGVELTIDPVSGAIASSERFFATYGINNIQTWLQAILEEDRETVKQVALHPDLEPPHRLYYRLVTQKGVIRSVEHVILARLNGGIRTEIRPAETDQATTGFLPTIYLQTIAIQHDLQLKKDSAIQFPQAGRLTPILKEIRDCLKMERIESDIELSPAVFEPNCSLCGAGSDIRSAFALTFKGLTLDRADLEVLVNNDHSLFRIGAGSPWKAMLNHLHRTGLHVVVSVNIDDSLVLTIGAGQGD